MSTVGPWCRGDRPYLVCYGRLGISAVVHMPGCDQWTLETGLPLPANKFEEFFSVRLWNDPGAIVEFIADSAFVAIDEKTVAALLNGGFFPA